MYMQLNAYNTTDKSAPLTHTHPAVHYGIANNAVSCKHCLPFMALNMQPVGVWWFDDCFFLLSCILNAVTISEVNPHRKRRAHIFQRPV